MRRNGRARPPVQAPSAFAGFRFPPEVILLAVRWYLRYGLLYRDLEELLCTALGVQACTCRCRIRHPGRGRRVEGERRGV